MRHILAGRKGEKTAARYLKHQGYHVVELNYRSKFGEIDIIAKKDGVTHFVEVKARSTARFGKGYEAVGQAKQIKLIKTAEAYMAEKGECPAQFDVVSIDGDEITFLPNAFGI